MILFENIRIAVTIPRSMNVQLKQEAEYQGFNSVSKLVLSIIKYYLAHKDEIYLD